MDNQAWMRRDLAHLWHPCTQMKDHERLPLIPVAKAQGIWLEDFSGQRYLDAISSWWVNIFGHCNARINAALVDQLQTLEHVILAGFTHQPIIELSEQLIALAPPGLARCFYADNGASCIEVALKMSLHYWHNLGAPEKTRFVSLQNGYHGETAGALAVTDIPLFSSTYAPLLTSQWRVPSPDCSLLPADTWEAHSRAQFIAMETLLHEKHREICAVIVEPLVQGAAGMRMYHPVYLQLLREACDRYQVHFIADEIAVGFGRTGTLFACEQASITPDFLCLSKALTAGYLPMSVVLTRENIYQAFYDQYETLKGFLHSHSYTGNALAARAALASLALFSENAVIENNRRLAAKMASCAQPLANHPHIAGLRQTGMILAMDLVQDKTDAIPYDWRERRGLRVYEAALQQGVLLRPIGNCVYVMPPYVIEKSDIEFLFAVLIDAIDCATREAGGSSTDNSIALP